MATHIAWRLRSLWTPNNQWGINELEMASTTGGTNLCTGGTPTTNTTYGGYYGPDKAFNGDLGNGSGEYAGSYELGHLGYIFAAPVEINQVRINPFSDTSLSPKIFVIESSDDTTNGDDGTWNMEWVGYAAAWSYGTLSGFVRPTVGAGPHSYWGILHTRGLNPADSYRGLVLMEFELRDSIGGTNLTGSGTGIAWPFDGGHPAANLFDHNTGGSEFYNGNDNQEITFVVYDFTTPVNVAEYAFTAQAGGNYGRATGQGFVTYSDDGKSFVIGAPYNLVDGVDYVSNVGTLALGGGGGGSTRRRAAVVVC